ncbi:MAG TPA: Gfo/Idh/MocA family oxidoreductase [Planctomycetes bacterium]|nr:Gfo/Idh/MocA family oxidoreductase [Planctomycetota bacterium]
MNLTPEERAVGRENYYEAAEVNRRDFMLKASAIVGTGGAGLGAFYFGYEKIGDPVRIGVIGTGDEGNVLLGAMNPDYQQVVAIADIRPSNIHRAFHGDYDSPGALKARPGLMSVYGWNNEREARKHVKVYVDYKEILADKDIEAVVIALPLHLHASVAIEAMLAGKHVLTEKLMGKTVAACKWMSRVSYQEKMLLATGHQRHYSILYDNAVNMLRWGLLGEIHHIRAQWHRGNLPGRDSWQKPLPGGEMRHDKSKPVPLDVIANNIKKWTNEVAKLGDSQAKELLKRKLTQWEMLNEDISVEASKYGYVDNKIGARDVSALEELIRWRLFERTGGGLMAELGSHQLDAASIFISALRADGKKAHPLSVHAVGGRHLFAEDRDSADHVYCMFEFPGPGYDKNFPVGYRDVVNMIPDPESGVPSYDDDAAKRIIVSYSSINGNGFGGYGEVVMGTRGTLVLDREKEAMLYSTSSPSTRVGIKNDGGGPTMDTSASGQAGAVAQTAQPKDVSRGYREELEHWAWCIRQKNFEEAQPRCIPEVALADAILALTANVAIGESQKGNGGYIEFKEEWFDMHNDDVPPETDVDGNAVTMESEKAILKL